MPGTDIVAAIQRGIRDYGEMDGQTGREKKQAYIDRSGSDGGENQGVLSDKSRTNVDIERFTTHQGEVYGFVTKEDKTYLYGKKITPDRPTPQRGNRSF